MQADDRDMTLRSIAAQLGRQDSVNFLLTNRVPRAVLTRLVGRISKIEHPLVYRAGLALWRLFTAIDLQEAKQSHFRSLHACFTRELKAGARPLETDPRRLVSPCDALIGAHGRIERGMVLQAKGMVYPLAQFLGEEAAVRDFEGGCYVTLRLTSAMYHRLHAPADLTVERVRYFSGDTWNVNPAALKRIDRLFCKNERAVLSCRLPDGTPLLLVPVAAILVASIRLHFLDVLLHLRYRGANDIPCHAALERGAEMGWFEHGSTVIVLAPPGFSLCAGLGEGGRINMGQGLLQRD